MQISLRMCVDPSNLQFRKEPLDGKSAIWGHPGTTFGLPCASTVGVLLVGQDQADRGDGVTMDEQQVTTLNSVHV